jgi:mRNA interferase MazF
MKIRKFNIYLADLSPRFGTESGKTRPVMVIQTNLLNDGLHPSTIVCPISTNVIQGVDILRVHLSSKAGGLKKDSDILVDQIRAIDNRRFVRRLGELNSTHKSKLMENIKILLLE